MMQKSKLLIYNKNKVMWLDVIKMITPDWLKKSKFKHLSKIFWTRSAPGLPVKWHSKAVANNLPCWWWSLVGKVRRQSVAQRRRRRRRDVTLGGRHWGIVVQGHEERQVNVVQEAQNVDIEICRHRESLIVLCRLNLNKTTQVGCVHSNLAPKLHRRDVGDVVVAVAWRACLRSFVRACVKQRASSKAKSIFLRLSIHPGSCPTPCKGSIACLKPNNPLQKYLMMSALSSLSNTDIMRAPLFTLYLMHAVACGIVSNVWIWSQKRETLFQHLPIGQSPNGLDPSKNGFVLISLD